MTVYVDEYLIKKEKRKEKKNKDNQERQRTYCKYKNGKIGGKYSRIVDIKWTRYYVWVRDDILYEERGVG